MEQFSHLNSTVPKGEPLDRRDTQKNEAPKELPLDSITCPELSDSSGPGNPGQDMSQRIAPFCLTSSWNEEERNAYACWKQAVEQGKYPPTTLPAFLTLIEEWLSGETLPCEQVVRRMEALMRAYPEFTAADQRRLVYWATLFAWCHHVPLPSLQDIRPCDMETPEILFRINLGLDQNRHIHPLNITWQELILLSDDSFMTGPVFGRNGGLEDPEYLCSLFSWIDAGLYARSGKGLLETYGPVQQEKHQMIGPLPFDIGGNLKDFLLVRPYTSSVKFRTMVTRIIREADRQIRIQHHWPKHFSRCRLDAPLNEWIEFFVQQSMDPFWNPWQFVPLQGRLSDLPEGSDSTFASKDVRSVKKKKSRVKGKPEADQDRAYDLKQEIASRDLNFDQIQALRQESDHVRDVLHVEEEEDEPQSSSPHGMEGYQSEYEQQILKFVKTLQPAEVKFLLRLHAGQGQLPSSAHRLELMKAINEMSDIYLKRPILEQKRRKIRLVSLTAIDFRTLMETYPQITARILDGRPRSAAKKHSSRKSSSGPCLDSNENRKPKELVQDVPGAALSNQKDEKKKIKTPPFHAAGLSSWKPVDLSPYPPSENALGLQTPFLSAADSQQPPAHYRDHQECWDAFWDSLEPVFQEAIVLLLREEFPLKEPVSCAKDLDPDEIHRQDPMGKRPLDRDFLKGQEYSVDSRAEAYEMRKQRLDQLAEREFLMADALVDEINFRFESYMNDLLIDGNTLDLDDIYRESLDFLCRQRKKDYHTL